MFYKAIPGFKRVLHCLRTDMSLTFSPLGGSVSIHIKTCVQFSLAIQKRQVFRCYSQKAHSSLSHRDTLLCILSERPSCSYWGKYKRMDEFSQEVCRLLSNSSCVDEFLKAVWIKLNFMLSFPEQQSAQSTWKVKKFSHVSLKE